MALSAESVALTCVPTGRRVNRDFQRMVVLIAVNAMATGAGRLTGPETSGHRQRLRPVEPARPAVRPELPLWIVVGNGLADEKRQRVVLVGITCLEPEEHIVLVAVAVRAGIEDLTRRHFL